MVYFLVFNIWLASVRYRSDETVSDRCVKDVNPKAFALRVDTWTVFLHNCFICVSVINVIKTTIGWFNINIIIFLNSLIDHQLRWPLWTVPIIHTAHLRWAGICSRCISKRSQCHRGAMTHTSAARCLKIGKKIAWWAAKFTIKIQALFKDILLHFKRGKPKKNALFQ